MRFVSGRLIKRSKSTIYTIYFLYKSRSIQLFNVFGLILLPDISHLSRFGFKVKNGTDCNKFNFSSTNGDVNSCIPDRDHVKNLDVPTQLYRCATYTLRLFTSMYNNFHSRVTSMSFRWIPGNSFLFVHHNNIYRYFTNYVTRMLTRGDIG